ncbi:MAG: hypothetical protein QMC19_00850 [Flavobacteriaceae bacterium]|jgi:uncharacterized protein with FMN-binding domain
MNKLVAVIFLFMSIISKSFSQKSLSDYSYVIVSEQFEFQQEKDKYQLNSLTKFLFNKYGFHAYFDREVPLNVFRCDGLWAEAEGTPGFIITKVQLVLRDCTGEEVFRTNYGKSKVKDYKKAYYESVRNAFNDIIKLNVNQKDIEVVDIEITSESQNLTDNTKNLSVVETSIVATNSIKKTPLKKVEPTIEKTINLNLPLNKYTNYNYMGTVFLLRKTAIGYSLYQELIDTDDDLLLIGKIDVKDSQINFKNEKNKILEVFFDESNNLIIGSGNKRKSYNYIN